jgi:hypothetical protein
MFTILPGLGVPSSKFQAFQALAEPSEQRRSPQLWTCEVVFSRFRADRFRCPHAFRTMLAASGTYACPAASGNRIFTKGKETLVLWAVE